MQSSGYQSFQLKVTFYCWVGGGGGGGGGGGCHFCLLVKKGDVKEIRMMWGDMKEKMPF